VHKTNINEKYAKFSEQWSPRVIAEANGQYVKLAKVEGEFVWHAHADEDEIFIVYKGKLMIDMHDQAWI